jgi:hypothetical protein
MDTIFKENRIFRKLNSGMRDRRAELNSVFDNRQIKAMLNLRKDYGNVFNGSSMNKIEQKKKLLEVLLVSSGYIERLTAIKNDLYLIWGWSKRTLARAKRVVREHDGYSTMPKKDQDNYVETQVGVFSDFEVDLEWKTAVVENAIESLDKLQYALKSALSAMRDEDYE